MLGFIQGFSNIDQSALHLIPLHLEYFQLPYNVQDILIPLLWTRAHWTVFLAIT